MLQVSDKLKIGLHVNDKLIFDLLKFSVRIFLRDIPNIWFHMV